MLQTKVVLELGYLDSRTHDDQLQIGSAAQDHFYQPDQNVRIQRPLVSLVQYDKTILAQFGVEHTLSQKNSVGAELYLGFMVIFLIESHTISYLLSQIHLHLRAYSLTHCYRRHSTRLTHANHLVLHFIKYHLV